jgi:hypothetical protein
MAKSNRQKNTPATKPVGDQATAAEASEEQAVTAEPKGFAEFEGEDGNKYAVVLPRLRYGRNIYRADEVAADEKLREELVKLAWKGKDGQRNEEDFEKNGVLRIVY